MKRNSFKTLSVRKVDVALRCGRTYFGRADASTQPGKTANPLCIIPAFFALKNVMPEPLLAYAVTFFATEQLKNLGKMPHTE